LQTSNTTLATASTTATTAPDASSTALTDPTNTALTSSSASAKSTAIEAVTVSASLLQAFKTSGSIANATINLGKVRYNINTGRLTFNGKALQGGQQGELAAKCRQVLKGRR